MALTAELRSVGPLKQHPAVQKQTVVQHQIAAQKQKIQHPILVIQLLELYMRAKQLINGPNAYRGAAFVKWKKEMDVFLDSAYLFGANFDSKARFHARKFGRSTNVLTDTQIYSLFKQDMINTIADLHRLFSVYQLRGEIGDNSLHRLTSGMLANSSILQLAKDNVFMIAIVFAGLVAIGSAIVYLLN